MERGRGGLLAGLVLLALILACFARLVAKPSWLLVDGGAPSVDHAQRDDFRPVGNDLTFFYLPHYLRLADQYHKLGEVPQWDSSGFAGRPLVGNPQAGLFYPPLRVIWGLRSPAALGWLTVGHLLWSGLGLLLLMRSLGFGLPAAVMAAGTFQTAPYILAQVVEGHYPHVWAASWYPWAFWSFLKLRRGEWLWGLALPPILALAFLTGHAQEWYYLVFVLGLWALWDAVRTVRYGRPAPELRSLAGWSFVLALSLGLVAVELIPDTMAQAWTLRGSKFTLEKVSRYQVQALNLFQLLNPGALGGPADYFGPDNYWETVLSIGIVPLLLVAVAVARYPDRRLVRGWLILVVGTVAFAGGRKFGLFPLLFELVPGMDRFRVAARSLFLANLGAAVLAGAGLETLLHSSFRAEDWRWLAARFRLWALAIGAILLFLVPFAKEERTEPRNAPSHPLTLRETRLLLRRAEGKNEEVAQAAVRIAGSGTFWCVLAGVGVILCAGSRPLSDRTRCAWLLGLLGLLELGAYGQSVVKVAPPSQFLGSDRISDALRNAEPPVAGPFRIRARDSLYPDLRATSNGFEKIDVNDSFQIQHAADLYESLYALLYVPPVPDPNSPMSEVVARHHEERRQRMLDRLNVAFLVSGHVESNPRWPLVATGTTERSSVFAVHRNPTALPRAYVVPRVSLTGGDETSVVDRFREVDPRDEVLVAVDPLPPGGPRQPFTPALVDSSDPDRQVITVTTEAPGFLVVTETWMPGWYAQDNGRPVPLYRGNHAQRAIPLFRGGRHEVILRYEAPGLARGSAVTLASIVAWAAVVIATAVFPWPLRQVG